MAEEKKSYMERLRAQAHPPNRVPPPEPEPEPRPEPEPEPTPGAQEAEKAKKAKKAKAKRAKAAKAEKAKAEKAERAKAAKAKRAKASDKVVADALRDEQFMNTNDWPLYRSNVLYRVKQLDPEKDKFTMVSNQGKTTTVNGADLAADFEPVKGLHKGEF